MSIGPSRKRRVVLGVGLGLGFSIAMVLGLLAAFRWSGPTPAEPGQVDGPGVGFMPPSIPRAARSTHQEDHAPSPMIEIAVFLSGPSEFTLLNPPLESHFLRGSFDGIAPWESLPPRAEAFVDRTLVSLRERFSEGFDYDAPFTEEEIAPLVAEAMAVDAESGTGSARLLLMPVLSIHGMGGEEHFEEDTLSRRDARKIHRELCESLLVQQDSLVRPLLAQVVRQCDVDDSVLERHAPTMPIDRSTFMFWIRAAPKNEEPASDLHERAVAAIAQLTCDDCTSTDPGVSPRAGLAQRDLALRKALRRCAIDLGLEPGVRDLSVIDDPLRVCVEAAGDHDVSRVIAHLLE